MEHPWRFCDFWGQRERVHIQAEPFASCVNKGRLLHPSELSFCTTRKGLGLIARVLAKIQWDVVHLLSRVQLFVTPRTAAHKAPLSSTTSPSLLKFLSVESVMLFDHLILCCPLLLLLSIFPSIRVFSNKLALRIRWPKDWSFSISPSNEYSGLISFWTDWLDLLAVQGTLKSLLLHHSSKASILQHSAFFIV